MRLILDENLPLDLVGSFEPPHDADHVERLGWKGVKNGDLLGRISGNYDAFLTGDTNLQHQQNLSRYDVAVIVIHPRRSTLAEFVALVPQVLAALPGAPKGAVTVISAQQLKVDGFDAAGHDAAGYESGGSNTATLRRHHLTRRLHRSSGQHHRRVQ